MFIVIKTDEEDEIINYLKTKNSKKTQYFLLNNTEEIQINKPKKSKKQIIESVNIVQPKTVVQTSFESDCFITKNAKSYEEYCNAIRKKILEPNQLSDSEIRDIGYTAFLSVMLDVKTSEVISYSLSDNLQMGFVIDTINSGIQKYPSDNLIIHSDRGVHYTNNVYQTLLKNNNIQQSMSAPATSRDNALIESFFGHLKDELDYKKCKTFEELSALVDDYMYNYNYTRKQWSKNKMTPIEYKNFLLIS